MLTIIKFATVVAYGWLAQDFWKRGQLFWGGVCLLIMCSALVVFYYEWRDGTLNTW